MNRTKQLKLLGDEVRRLFFEGTSESDAYDQLRSDQRFDTVQRASIQSLYRKLRNDADKEAKVKELNEQKRYRQNTENLLLCENQLIKEEREVFENIWGCRYFSAIESINGNKFTYEMTDFYQNVSQEVSLLVDDSAHVVLYALNGQFGLAEIRHALNDLLSVHLVYIDLIEGKMELVQEIKRDEHRFMNMHVFVDSLDRSKSVLAFFGQRFSVIECSLSVGKVNIGEEVIILENYGLIPGNCSYFNKQLFELTFDDEHRNNFNHASIIVRNFDNAGERNTLKLEPLPSNINAQCLPMRSLYSWFCDHVFIPIQFRSTGFYGIAFSEPQTCKWSILEFAVNLHITNLTLGGNCDLLVYAGRRRQEGGRVSKIYKLPLRKPDSLRYKAWLKTISWFKKQGVADPYKEARRFLPLTSEIHTPFTVDEHENDGQE